MNHGGRREGAGRPQGSTNRATKEQGARLSELARLHTEMALDTLVDIASNGKNENARIPEATAIINQAISSMKVLKSDRNLIIFMEDVIEY